MTHESAQMHQSGIYMWTGAGAQPFDRLLELLESQRAAGRRIVTTNGCFDLLHIGHIRFLSDARALGDLLIVGLNSDASVHRLKGAGRPLVAESDRAAMLAALRAVDHVVVFDAQLPNDFLAAVRPAIHCKAGDYTIEALPEAEIVRQHGGVVQILPLAAGHSTSRLIDRVLNAARANVLETPVAATSNDPQSLVSGRLLDNANLLRQISYGLRDQIVLATKQIAAARVAGRRIVGIGAARALSYNPTNRAVAESGSSETVDALGPADLLIIASPGAMDGELAPSIAAARGRGATAILIDDREHAPDDFADLILRIPTNDTSAIDLAQLAVVDTIAALATQLAQGSDSE